MSQESAHRARIGVSRAALAHNLQIIQKRVPSAQVMAIVKANAYGHGREMALETGVEHGVRWFGLAQHAEALAARHFLDGRGVSPEDVRVFSWIAPPGTDWARLVDAGIDVSASTVAQLEEIAALGDSRARVHLKVDVGMSRAGALPEVFPHLVEVAHQLESQGLLQVEGIWSHLSQADDPKGPGALVTNRQQQVFSEAVEVARSGGLNPTYRHLGATAAALWHPQCHFDMVRVGIGLYGLSPAPDYESGAELGLVPVMELRAPLIMVKQLPAGTAVSYGGTWQAEVPTWVGLVPLGYADGVPRAASNRVQVAVRSGPGAVRANVVGRICMDQFMIDLGTGNEPAANIGDEVVLFGSGAQVPSADDWARAAETINYEIVARMSGDLPRMEVTNDL